MQDPDDLDEIKRQTSEGDTNSAKITAYQAQKCAAILEAYVDGQVLYREHVNIIAQFFKAAAIEGSLGHGYSRPAAQSFWRQLDQLAWPRHGGPQPQAD